MKSCARLWRGCSQNRSKTSPSILNRTEALKACTRWLTSTTRIDSCVPKSNTSRGSLRSLTAAIFTSSSWRRNRSSSPSASRQTAKSLSCRPRLRARNVNSSCCKGKSRKCEGPRLPASAFRNQNRPKNSSSKSKPKSKRSRSKIWRLSNNLYRKKNKSAHSSKRHDKLSLKCTRGFRNCRRSWKG